MKMIGKRHVGSQKTVAFALAAMVVVILQLNMTMTYKVGNDHSISCTSPETSDGNPSNGLFPNTTILGERHMDLSQTIFDGIEARSFKPWKGPLPCVEPEEKWDRSSVQRSPTEDGFLMVKEMKTGGSTAAGINLRIARNVARRQYPHFPICKLRNDHATAHNLQYNNRDRKKSFLWTILRHPRARAISQFFHFEVSREKVEPTDKNFQEWIQGEWWMHHYYLRTLSVEKQQFRQETYDGIAAGNKILDDYDFLGITERMDESAVALQLLLGLKTSDVLYLNAKNSGGFDDGASPRGCVYIVPSFVTPGMEKFFQSEDWDRLAGRDTSLYKAANRSLDLTIRKLGVARFDMALQNFRFAMQRVRAFCLPKVVFPCTVAGEMVREPNCTWADSGCGMDCIDDLVSKGLHMT